MTKNNKNQEIEQALKRLQEIISQLEKKDISLKEHLQNFKEGALLAKKIKEYLKEAENEFYKIKKELESEI